MLLEPVVAVDTVPASKTKLVGTPSESQLYIPNLTVPLAPNVDTATPMLLNVVVAGTTNGVNVKRFRVCVPAAPLIPGDVTQ